MDRVKLLAILSWTGVLWWIPLWKLLSLLWTGSLRDPSVEGLLAFLSGATMLFGAVPLAVAATWNLRRPAPRLWLLGVGWLGLFLAWWLLQFTDGGWERGADNSHLLATALGLTVLLVLGILWRPRQDVDDPASAPAE